MDENSRHYRNWLALLWLPLALLIMVPVVILLGLSFYVRAAVTSLAMLIRYLLGYKTSIPSGGPMQPPHVFEVPVPAKKKE